MPRTPKYCRYRKDFARVTIGDKTIHLGRYDDPESKAKYKRLIAEWAAGPKVEPTTDSHEADATVTVAEILAGYIEHATSYYGEGKRLDNIKRVIRTVDGLYGDTPAAEFGPKRLKTVRQQFIDRGNCRRTVNEFTRDTVAIFRWAAENEMIPGSVVHSLQAVRSLRKGRSDVPEGKPVTIVPEATVNATLDELTPTVADMVRLQLLTGMRPGELCNLTPGEVDRMGDVWLYRPSHHKTSHLDHDRVVAIGPKAQMVLRPYLLRADDAPCFSPREAYKQHLDRQHDERKTPMSCGNKPNESKRRKALAKLADRYDVCAYRKAIHRACDRAFPAPEGMEGDKLKNGDRNIGGRQINYVIRLAPWHASNSVWTALNPCWATNTRGLQRSTPRRTSRWLWKLPARIG
jgi:integrase